MEEYRKIMSSLTTAANGMGMTLEEMLRHYENLDAGYGRALRALAKKAQEKEKEYLWLSPKRKRKKSRTGA